MSEPKPAVETRQLVKVYGDGDAVRALDGVSLVVAPSEFVAIVGPSGSGKSTLLNLIGALDRPSSGEVVIDGLPLSAVRDLDRFRSRTVGFVFQTHNLIPTMTAVENTEVPMVETRLRAAERHARARDLLELVGLGHRLDFVPGQLSGGERQRVAIARALANRPVILLADEPTGNLDSKTTGEIMTLLADLNRSQGTTVILVTHNHEVARATRRVITLRDGRVQHDIPVRSAFDSDLIDLKYSTLGQAVLTGQDLPEDFRPFAEPLRLLLNRV